jgi:pilus assembly protein CpaC
MKTNQKIDAALLNTRAMVCAMALAGAAGAMLCVPTGVRAQTAMEAGAVAKSTTAPVAAQSQSRAGGAAPMQMTISMAQPAVPAQPDVRGPNCTGAVRSESNVVVPVGKSTIIALPEPVRNRTLGNPNVVQASMVSPQSMYLLGRSVGTTNMIVQGRSGACSIVDVVVNADAGGLQTSLAQLMPGESRIRVTTAADNLVLTGSVSNAQSAAMAMEIARAYAASAQAGNDKAGGNPGGGVLNMMTVDTPQQVMLEVKVAEVSKTLLNQMGSALNIQGGFGSWSGGLLTSLLTGSSTAVFGNKANNRPFQVQLDPQRNDNLVKVLAEPNLVTLSGQEASFLAGGKIYIPVAQSNILGGAATITLQEEEFGVGLKFTPTVMANGRINLKVAPEVSELSPTGATVTGSSLTGQTILPLITTRRASTTVQMRDGESFAIGGDRDHAAPGAADADGVLSAADRQLLDTQRGRGLPDGQHGRLRRQEPPGPTDAGQGAASPDARTERAVGTRLASTRSGGAGHARPGARSAHGSDHRARRQARTGCPGRAGRAGRHRARGRSDGGDAATGTGHGAGRRHRRARRPHRGHRGTPGAGQGPCRPQSSGGRRERCAPSALSIRKPTGEPP